MKLKKEWKMKMVARTILMFFMVALLVLIPFKLDAENLSVSLSLSHADEKPDGGKDDPNENGDSGETDENGDSGETNESDPEDPDDPNDDLEDDEKDIDDDDSSDDTHYDVDDTAIINSGNQPWQLNLEDLEDLKPISSDEEKRLVGNWDSDEDETNNSNGDSVPNQSQ